MTTDPPPYAEPTRDDPLQIDAVADSIDAIARLALVARSLNSRVSVHEIVEIVLLQGMRLLGADAALFAVCEDGMLTPIALQGGDARPVPGLWPMSIDAPLPIACAARERSAVWVRDAVDGQDRFPRLHRALPTIEAWAALPVELEGDLVGVFGFCFRLPQLFDEAHRLYVRTVADLSARPLALALGRTADRPARPGLAPAPSDALALAALVHDLRAPLSAIALNAGSLRRVADDGSIGAALADRIEHDVVAVQRVLMLLDVSLRLGERYDDRREVVDLAQVVREVVEASPAAPALHVDCDLDGVFIRTDRFQFERLLANLLDNAVRHSPQDLSVRVGCRATDGHVVIVVEDAGPGVRPEDRQRVFSMHETDATDGVHSGLGLHLVHVFAQANGGEVTLDESDQGGARFTVAFPVHPGPPDTRATPAQVQP